MDSSAHNSTRTLRTSDGADLFTRDYLPKAEVARILIVHGLGEHSGRYTHLATRFLQKGLGVKAYDHRGHGQSSGKRGHINSFAEYRRDLETMVSECRKDLPEGAKFFILGHSMGGLLVLNFAQQFSKRVDGIIASSPGLCPANPIPIIKGTAGRVMSKIWPELSFDNELVPEHLSHDSSVVEAYINDPLVHRRITARWFTEVMAAMSDTRRNASQITAPVLMQIAGDDRIVDPSASRDFFDRLSMTDKKLCYYDSLFHEIYNETDAERNRVLQDLEDWVDCHISS